MKGPNVVLDKSVEFAIAITNCTSKISKERNEFVITKQLLRSGTSIAANVSESEFAQSKLDFIHKLSIGLKEANESRYWLKLLNQTKFLAEDEFKMLTGLNNEIIYLLISSINTAKKNIKKTESGK